MDSAEWRGVGVRRQRNGRRVASNDAELIHLVITDNGCIRFLVLEYTPCQTQVHSYVARNKNVSVRSQLDRRELMVYLIPLLSIHYKASHDAPAKKTCDVDNASGNGICGLKALAVDVASYCHFSLSRKDELRWGTLVRYEGAAPAFIEFTSAAVPQHIHIVPYEDTMKFQPVICSLLSVVGGLESGFVALGTEQHDSVAMKR